MPTGTARIVYVHGNGNKLAPEFLKQKWDRALFGEDKGHLTTMAYYADLRYPEPLPNVVADLEGGEGVILEAADDDFEPTDVFIASITSDYPVPDDAAAAFQSWVAKSVAAADAAAERAPSPMEAFGFIPKPLRKRLMRRLLRLTFKDVHAYFFEGFGEGFKQRVRDELVKGGDPLIVIGHSLGSIVSYEVLREEQFKDTPVALYLTVGSPLGITEVQDFTVQPLQWPSQVHAWRNLADPFDVVALDKGLANDYDPKGKIVDTLVNNDTSNNHGITGYLSLAVARNPIRDLLQ